MVQQLSLICFVLVFAGPALLLLLPSASGFSSGRSSSSPQQRHHHSGHSHQHIGLLSSEESDIDEMTNEVRQEFGGGGLNSMDEIMENVATLAEDMAEEASKKCHALQIPVDYEGLKSEFLECSISIVTQITTGIGQATLTARLRQAELEKIQEAVSLSQPLTTEQKQFLTNNFFEPVCSTMIPAISECDNPKYATLTKANQCKPEYEKDGEAMFKAAVNDVCRNHGAWIFDFLDAKPATCVNDFLLASRTEEHQERLRYLRGLQVNNKKPGKPRQLESYVEFCNITETIGLVVSDLFITPCKENQKPGEVLLNTFKDTYHFWNSKCGSGAQMIATTTVGWLQLVILCMTTIVLNWNKNLSD